jgi:dinuclear metal center YbgI/SA1388 family protein
MLFVHHGLLWGQCEPVTGIYYSRIRELIRHNIALYACHLPLDAHPVSGNNYGLAFKLGLQNLTPFGEWRGSVIGVSGSLPVPRTTGEIIATLFPDTAEDCIVLPFGRSAAVKVAIISGGGGDETAQAAAIGADVFITGEIGHTQYHTAEEMGITVIAAGHYRTETVGVELMRQKIERETDIETVFIDVPTGL